MPRLTGNAMQRRFPLFLKLSSPQKKLLFGLSIVITLLGVSGRLSAQATNVADQKQVLEKCVQLTQLQPSLPKNDNDTYKQLIVMQHAVSFDENNGARHEGQLIIYKSKGEIRSGNTDAYFYFNTFNIEQNSAKVEFTFYYDQSGSAPKMQVVEIQLAKTANGWEITNSKIEAR